MNQLWNLQCDFLSLRDKVLILSIEEGCPFEEAMVQNKCINALSTGLKNNNI